MQRNTAAIWLIKAKFGGSYIPPIATGALFRDIEMITFAADFIEDLGTHGATEGCDAALPPNYCPEHLLTKVQAAKMLLKTKYGASYDPGTVSGMIFDDVVADDFAS